MCLYARAQAPALFGSGRAPGLWFCLLTACCAVSLTYAQVRPRGLDAYPEWQSQPTTGPAVADTTITALQIGDTIPEALWHLPLQVINHPDGNETITLNDYRGKLVVLDFWNTACIPCIKAFPKLSNLQFKFENHLQIVLSNRQPASQVTQRMKKNPIPTNLPCLVDQQTLYAYFPYRVVPHYVWIGTNGTVMAMTSGEEITQEAIKEMLSGRADVALKRDILTDPPYFLHPQTDSKRVASYMLFRKGYDAGLPAKAGYHQQGDYSEGFTASNYRVIELYKLAASKLFQHDGHDFTDNRCIIEATDTSALHEFHTYERIVPRISTRGLDSILMDDLNHLTGYHGRIVLRNVPCYVIIRGANDTGPPHKSDSQRKATMRMLLNLWNNATGREERAAVLVDESGYTGMLDTSIYRVHDIDLLRQALRLYNLDIKQANRTLPMLVISDKTMPIFQSDIQ
ncbi:TlpA family protein disulfide reductase [Parapedobacter sp. 2B3]|uniref:TlpA family protein disulfide reductase n=1 Tax=Parapedobacter sp. 2B3 TaxID=3342381 RepID=UPI0035B5A57C